MVVKSQVACQALFGCTDRIVGMQIYLLVFDALPEPFHEYVIPPAAFAVHAELDPVVNAE